MLKRVPDVEESDTRVRADKSGLEKSENLCFLLNSIKAPTPLLYKFKIKCNLAALLKICALSRSGAIGDDTPSPASQRAPESRMGSKISQCGTARFPESAARLGKVDNIS